MLTPIDGAFMAVVIIGLIVGVHKKRGIKEFEKCVECKEDYFQGAPDHCMTCGKSNFEDYVTQDSYETSVHYRVISKELPDDFEGDGR